MTSRRRPAEAGPRQSPPARGRRVPRGLRDLRTRRRRRRRGRCRSARREHARRHGHARPVGRGAASRRRSIASAPSTCGSTTPPERRPVLRDRSGGGRRARDEPAGAYFGCASRAPHAGARIGSDRQPRLARRPVGPSLTGVHYAASRRIVALTRFAATARPQRHRERRCAGPIDGPRWRDATGAGGRVRTADPGAAARPGRGGRSAGRPLASRRAVSLPGDVTLNGGMLMR